MKKIPLLFILFFAMNCFAQLSKTHYIPPLTSSPGVAPQDHYIYISTPSLSEVKFKIIPIGGTAIEGRVSKNSPYSPYRIGIDDISQLFVSKGSTGKVQNKGYIIESDGLIYANVWMTNSVVVIQPENGKVLAVIDGTELIREGRNGGDVMNGIAHDKRTGKTYMTGKNWTKLFEVRFKKPEAI